MAKKPKHKTETNSIQTLKTGPHKKNDNDNWALGLAEQQTPLSSQHSGAGRARPPTLRGWGGPSRDGSPWSWQRAARRGGVCDGHTGVQGGDQSLKPEPRLSATMHPKSRIKKSIGQVPRDAAYLWNLKNMIQKNLITKQETDSQRTILWLPEGKVGEGYIGNWELTDTYDCP